MKVINKIIDKINILKGKNYVQDLYNITNIYDEFFVQNNIATKILEIIPTNISDLNEEKKDNITIIFKEVLKECDFPFKIISNSYKLDIEKQIIEMANITHKTELLDSYINYLKSITLSKEMYINKYYIVFNGMPVDNVNNMNDILKDINNKCEIFMNLEKVGVKVQNINSKDEIIKILTSHIKKGGEYDFE